MKKEDKGKIISQIADTIKAYNSFYLVETAGLDAEKTSELRRACYNADIKLVVVKNTLLHKALETLEGDYSELYGVLKESTSLMCTNVGNAPAKLLKDFVKKGDTLPLLKGAYVEETAYVGADQEQERTYRRRCGSPPVARQERCFGPSVRCRQAPWHPRDSLEERKLIQRIKNQKKSYKNGRFKSFC